MADFRHFLALSELGEVIAGHAPPSFQSVMMRGQRILQSGVCFQGVLDSSLFRNSRDKGQIAARSG